MESGRTSGCGDPAKGRPRRLVRRVVPLAVPVLAFWCASPARGGRPLEIRQSFESRPAVAVSPLRITDPAVDRQVREAITNEEALIRVESGLARDMSRLQDVVWCDELRERAAYRLYGDYYVSLIPQVLARQLPRLKIYQYVNRLWMLEALLDLSVAIDRIAEGRRTLERQYFEALAKPAPAPPGATGTVSVTAFEALDPEVRLDVIEALRERERTLQAYRRDAVDSFLLANRVAREANPLGVLPVDAAERAAASLEWMTSGAFSRKRALDQLVQQRTARKRELAHDLEVYDDILDCCGRKLAELTGGSAGAADPAVRAMIDRLKAREEKYKAEREKKKTEKKAVEDDLEKAQKDLEKLALGYEADGVKTTREGEGLFARAGSAADNYFAELNFRRRLLHRAAREATHLFEVGKSFAGVRQTIAAARVRILRASESKPAPADLLLALRSAGIDLGLSVLAARELEIEDSSLAQLDFFNGLLDQVMSLWDGRPEAKRLAWYWDLAWKGLDALQVAMGLFSGLMGFVVDEVKAIGDTTLPLTLPGRLESAWKQVLDKRRVTDKQQDFLFEALNPDWDSDQVRRHFGLPGTPAVLPYRSYYDGGRWIASIVKEAEGAKSPHELFWADGVFLEKTDGGLWRIGYGDATTPIGRLSSEYAIACQKAGATLQQIERTWRSMTLREAESGGLDFKKVFTPVTALTELFRAVCSQFDTTWGDPLTGKHIQKRKTELAAMEKLFVPLGKAGFDLARILTWADDPERQGDFWIHWRLYNENPEYRRFWSRAKTIQLEEGLKQTAAAAAADPRGGWEGPESNWDKAALHERILYLESSQPSPRMLARAHVQDALDKVALYNFAGARDSLYAAHEIDSSLLGYQSIQEIETLIAEASFYRDAARVVSDFGNEIAWLGLVRGVKTVLYARLQRWLPGLKPPGGFKGWGYADEDSLFRFLADAVFNKVNPLGGVISIKEYMENGALIAILSSGGGLAAKAFQESVIRDRIMINWLSIDPEWADKLADFAVDIGKDTGKAYVRDNLGAGWAIDLFYEAEKFRNENAEFSKMSALSLLRACLSDAAMQTRVYQQWLSVRRLATIVDAQNTRATIEDLEDELGRLAPSDLTGSGAGRVEEASRRLARSWIKVMARQYMGSRGLDENVLGLVLMAGDFSKTPNFGESLKAADDVLTGKTRKLDEILRIGRAAQEVLRILGPGKAKDLAKLAGERSGFHDVYDSLRAAAHLYAVNLVEQAAKSPEAARRLIEEVEANYNRRMKVVELKEAKDRKPGEPAPPKKSGPDFEMFRKNPQLLIELMRHVLVITPTGSGAIEPEYVKGRSDFDVTAVIDSNYPVTPEQRRMLEIILAEGFSAATAGSDPDDYSVSFMADRSSVVTGQDPLVQVPPSKPVDDTAGLTPAQIAAETAKAKQVVRDLETNLGNPERYITPGMVRALFYINEWGTRLMVRSEDGAWHFASKKELQQVYKNLPPDHPLRLIVENKAIRMSPEVALAVLLDNRGFTRVHARHGDHGEAEAAGKEAKPVTPDKLPAFLAKYKDVCKYGLRELLGFLACQPRTCKALNDLLDNPDTPSDHSSIAKIMREELARPDCPLKLTPEAMADAVQVLDIWSAVKSRGKGEDAIVAAIVKTDPIPQKGSKEYNEALLSFHRRSAALADAAANLTIDLGAAAYRPIFQAVADARRADTLLADAAAKNVPLADADRSALDAALRGLVPDDALRARAVGAAGQPPDAAAVAAVRERLAAQKTHFETLRTKEMLPLAVRFFLLESSSPNETSTPGQYNAMQRRMIDALEKAGLPKQEFKAILDEVWKHVEGIKVHPPLKKLPDLVLLRFLLRLWCDGFPPTDGAFAAVRLPAAAAAPGGDLEEAA